MFFLLDTHFLINIIMVFFSEVKVYALACLLKPEALLTVQQRLSHGTIELPFLGDIVKTYRYLFLYFIHIYWSRDHNILLFLIFFIYSIETGHLTGEVNISLKKPFVSCVVILHENVNLVGKLDKNYLRWERHGLKSCFLQTSLNIKYSYIIYILSYYNIHTNIGLAIRFLDIIA